MADYDASMPVYSRSGAAPVKVSADTSDNALANPLFVKITDGAQGVEVDASGNLQVVVSNGFALDSTLTTTNGKLDTVIGHVDGIEGALTTLNGKDFATQTTLALVKGDTANLDIALSALRDAIAGSGAGAKTLADVYGAVDGIEGSLTTIAGHVDGIESALATLNGKDFATQTTLAAVDTKLAGVLQVSATSAANSASNPLYVAITESGASSTEVHDYNTAASVAASGTSTHTRATTASKVMILKQILASASGAMKVEVKTGASGGTATKAVGFTSMANPTLDLRLAQPIEVPAGQQIEVVRTNREGAAMDVYSTIVGNEVAA